MLSIVNRPKILCIMPTYTCPASCHNCGTLSNPNVKLNISLETIVSAINQAKELGFTSIVFSGGEATLRFKDLCQAIAYAKSLDLPTRLVTNAHWATSTEKANKILDILLNVGLNEINYSTGDEHAKYIPIQRIITAIITTIKKEMNAYLMIEMREDNRIIENTILESNEIKMLSEEERKKLKINLSPWMPLHHNKVEKYKKSSYCNGQNIHNRKGCDSILSTYTVQADGKIGACCGIGMRLIPELHVGIIDESRFLHNAIKIAEEDFLKLWIYHWGPEKIIAWVSQKEPSIKWENMYSHKCQACLRLYKDDSIMVIIQKYYHEILSEIIFENWFDEEYFYKKLLEPIENFTEKT